MKYRKTLELNLKAFDDHQAISCISLYIAVHITVHISVHITVYISHITV